MKINWPFVTEPADLALSAGRQSHLAFARVPKDGPTLCNLETLTPVNACRVCVVEVEGSRALVPACSRRVEPGMRISTDSERVRHSRRLVLELLGSAVDLSVCGPEVHRWMARYEASPQRFGPEAATLAQERLTRQHLASVFAELAWISYLGGDVDLAGTCLAWAEQGIAFHEMAVAYRHAAPYRGLIDSVFRAAGLPLYLAEGRPLSEHPLGASVLARFVRC